MKQNKLLSLLGLCARARGLVSGGFMVEKAVKGGDARLVIAAKDASEASMKSYRDMCSFYHVPIYFYASKDELGHAIGKEMRASLAVTDQGFAQALEKMLIQEMGEA